MSAQAPNVFAQPPQPTVDISQAVGLAGQQIDPVLRQITEMYNRRAGDISGGISSLTGQYQENLGQYAQQIPGLFQHSLHLIKNTGEGLNAELTGFGKQQFHANNAAFDQAGLPHDAGGGDINLRDIGAGAGATAGAIGQAMLDALRTQQNNAESYAGKLPGFAGLEGAQNTQSVLGVLARRLADDLSAETAKTPGLVYQIYQDLLGNQRDQRDYDESVRQFNVSRQDQLNAKRAGVAGPNAPTNAGRLAYWRDEAKQRTEDTGDLWVGTTTGIRPYDADPRKPGIQRQRTQQGQAADYLNLGREASAQATVRRAATGERNAATSERRAATGERNAATAERRQAASAAQAQEREANRHAEALRRLKTAERNATTSAQRAALQRKRDAEAARHHRATEQISRSKGKKKVGGGTGFDPSTGKYG